MVVPTTIGSSYFAPAHLSRISARKRNGPRAEAGLDDDPALIGAEQNSEIIGVGPRSHSLEIGKLLGRRGAGERPRRAAERQQGNPAARGNARKARAMTESL